jgi:RNA polymerase-binding transcription factor DksA
MPHTQRKAQLDARAAELTARLVGIEDALDAPAPQDFEDQATEREPDEVLERLGLSAQQELRQIAAALDRLVGGTYGVCVRCGDDIASARLDLLPDTPFCAACAS